MIFLGQSTISTGHVSGSQTLNVYQAGYHPIQFHSTTIKTIIKNHHFPMVFLWFSPFSYGKTTIHHPFTSVFWGIPRYLAGGATSQRRSTESRDRRHRAGAASAHRAGRRAAAVWPVRAAGPGSPNGGGGKVGDFYGDFYTRWCPIVS